jgi:hypothetical protein
VTDKVMDSFTEWFCKNYPPNTVISDPAWHAPKIYRAALAAADNAALPPDVPPSDGEPVSGDAVLQHSALPEEPSEILASRLIDAWCADKGKKIPWAKAIQIVAIVTKQSDEERDRLLKMGDEDGSCEMCGRSDAPLLAAPHQNADQPKAAPQAPCTPRRSSPGLAERPDSPNGVSLERAAILDETDSGVKPAGVAPRVGEDEVIEKLHALIDLLAHRFKGYLPWPSELRDAVVRGHESFIAATIRKADELRALKGDAALKSKEGGAG